MSSSLRSASNASAAVFPDKKNCWLFSIFGVNMATPPKIPMFHATFNSSRLIWEKILLRVFQNSAMREAAARAAPNVGRNESNSKFAAENAARGPRCSVFFPGCQKTRLWGLSKRLEAARKARKGAAKREKRQESRQWAPNATPKPCSEAPWRRFLPSREQNRATAASPQRKNLLNATSI